MRSWSHHIRAWTDECMNAPSTNRIRTFGLLVFVTTAPTAASQRRVEMSSAMATKKTNDISKLVCPGQVLGWRVQCRNMQHNQRWRSGPVRFQLQQNRTETLILEWWLGSDFWFVRYQLNPKGESISHHAAMRTHINVSGPTSMVKSPCCDDLGVLLFGDFATSCSRTE